MAMPNTIEIRITASGAEQAAKILQGVAEAGGKIGNVVARGAQDAKRELDGLGSTARRVTEIFAGFTLGRAFEEGLVKIKEFITESAKLGFEAQIQEDAFKHLTQAAGVAGDTLLHNLQEASGGILNISDVMRAASASLIAGLQPDQIIKLMEIARQQSKLTGDTVADAFNKISEAIATQRERSLKQMLINADMANSIRSVALAQGLEADALSQGEKIQASYSAVVRATTGSVEALSKSTDTLKEAAEKAAGQWKQFKEDIGKPIAAFAIGAITTTFAEVEALVKRLSERLGDIGPQLADMKKVWIATWEQARASLAPVATMLEITIIPVLKLVGAAAATAAVGVAAAFTLVAGPIAYFASLLDDIAKGKLPDLKMAHKEQEVAAAEARVRLAEVVENYQRLAQGTTGATTATNGMSAALDTGKNKLGDFTRPLQGAVGDIEKVSNAIRGLTASLAKEVALPGETDLAALLEPFKKGIQDIKGLPPEAFESLMRWARGIAETTIAMREMKAVSAEAFAVLNSMPEPEVAPLIEAAELWAGLGAELDKIRVANEGADPMKQLEESLKATTAALVVAQARFGDATNDAAKLRDRVMEITDAMRLLATVRATAEDVAEAWSHFNEQGQKGLPIWQEMSTELGNVERVADALGQTFGDTLAEKIRVVEAAIRKAALAGLAGDVEKLKARLVELQGPLLATASNIEKAFADFDLQVRAWETISGAQERFFQRGLDGWAAQARAVGDYAGFFEAQLTIAFTRGKDIWSNLTNLAQGVAGDIRSAFGNFFVDFKANLDKGLSGWKSFTEALNSLWNSVMNAMVRRFGEFVADTLLSFAAGGGGGGSAAGGLIGLVASLLGRVGSGGGEAISPITGAPSALISEPPGSGSSSLATFGSAVSLFKTGVSVFSSASTVWQATVAGWDAGFGGLSGAASGFVNGLDTVGASIGALGSTFAAVTAAVSIAMVALRDDITDAGKAIISSFYAAAAATAIGTGWTGVGLIVAAVLAAIGAILDWTGIFEKASKAWLEFPIHLQETLGKEQDALKAFGESMTKASSLEGVAKNIEDFRHAIEEKAGVGGFFETTKGQGIFHVPGIPGATGTKHEGGISFDFGPFIQQMQDAIDKVMNTVRDTISVKFADLATRLLPDDLAAAFRTGMLDVLRKQFEDLAASTTATTDDVKTFEERMKAVGELLAAFAQEATELRSVATAAELTLPPAVADAVADRAAEIRQSLVDLAQSGTATADDLKRVEESIKALAAAGALYAQINSEIAQLTASFGDSAKLAIGAAKTQLALAGQAITDAAAAFVVAGSGPEAAAAAQALHKAIIDRYALERKLIADIEAAIANTLQTFGNQLLATSQFAANIGLERGNIDPFKNMLFSLEGIQQASDSAAIKLWAATAALNAIIAAIPSAVKGWQAAISDPHIITQGIQIAAGPSVQTLVGLFNQALNAGDIQGALTILGQGAQLIQGLATAAIAGVRQWESAAVDAATKAAQAEIDAVNARLQAELEANQLKVDANNEQIEALRTQRSEVEKLQQASREWLNIIKSIDQFISQLMTGNASPLNPAEAFAFAKSQYQTALAAFQGNQTPENANAVQQAAQTMLQAFQAFRPAGRPSPEYEALVNQTVAELKGVQAAAAAFITPEEEAVKQLQSIDAKIAELTEANKAIEAANKDLRANAAAQIKAIESSRDSTIASIHAAAEREIEGITSGIGGIMQQIAAEQYRLTAQLIAQQVETQASITATIGGIKTASENTVSALTWLNNAIYSVLTGKEVGAPPALARGGIVTRPTYALIGEAGPEAVIPLSSGSRAGGTVTLDMSGMTVNIVVPPGSDPRRAGREAADGFIDRLDEALAESPKIKHRVKELVKYS